MKVKRQEKSQLQAFRDQVRASVCRLSVVWGRQPRPGLIALAVRLLVHLNVACRPGYLCACVALRGVACEQLHETSPFSRASDIVPKNNAAPIIVATRVPMIGANLWRLLIITVC